MKRICGGMVAWIVVGILTAHAAGCEGKRVITERAVIEFLHQFEALGAQRDFALLEPYVHRDAVFRFNDGDFVGVAAVRGAFEKTWAATAQATEDKYYLSDIRVLSVDSRSASATYTYNWEGRFEDTAFAIKGRGTRVMLLVDGRLQIIHEHLSRFPETDVVEDGDG